MFTGDNMTLNKIALHGHKGKLGSLIYKLALHKGFEVFELGRETTVEELMASGSQIIIDVTSATGLQELLQNKPPNIPILTGSTGDLPWLELKRYAKENPVAVVSNFSVGVPLLLDLVKMATKILPSGWDIEVVEAHHNQKIDAPSGTAKRIIQAIQEGLSRNPNLEISDIPAHALRVGDTFGEHTVWMCGPGERLEIKHVATKRDVFAIGALRWAEWLLQQPNELYTP
jgi:4-hydroxy-tetrahydrodipicolinate reductase